MLWSLDVLARATHYFCVEPIAVNWFDKYRSRPPSPSPRPHPSSPGHCAVPSSSFTRRTSRSTHMTPRECYRAQVVKCHISCRTQIKHKQRRNDRREIYATTQTPHHKRAPTTMLQARRLKNTNSHKSNDGGHNQLVGDKFV